MYKCNAEEFDLTITFLIVKEDLELPEIEEK